MKHSNQTSIFLIVSILLNITFLTSNAFPERSWVIQTVDSAGTVGQYSAIDVDTECKPHISYYNATSRALKYAYNSGSWSIFTVDAGAVGKYTSIDLDYDDHPHISYSGDGEPRTGLPDRYLKYAYYNGGWTIRRSPEKYALYTSIAVDSNKIAHMSYQYGAISISNSKTHLKYARYDSAWNVEIADDNEPTDLINRVGSGNSIALDSKEKPNISYSLGQGRVRLRLGLTYYVSGWVHEIVNNRYTSGSGGTTDLAIDKNDYPHIVSRNSYYDEFMYTYKNASGLATEIVDSTTNTGKYSSVAVNKFIHSHVAYYDEYNSALKYAYRRGGWNTSIIDSVGDVGKYCSIAIDDNNGIYISYYDDTHDNLKYAFSEGLKISCPSYPDQTKWYNGTAAWFIWNQTEDPDVIGYLMVSDQDSATWVSYTNGFFTTETGYMESSLQSGENYFHLATVNSTSEVGGHLNDFVIRHTTSGPDVSSITHPDENEWYASRNVSLFWTAPMGDDESFTGYYYQLNRQSDYVPSIGDIYTPIRLASYTGLPNGHHYFHIRSIDTLGTLSSEAARFRINIVDLTPTPSTTPTPSVTPTPSPSITPTPSVIPTASTTPTPIGYKTPPSSPTPSLTPTLTPTPKPTPTMTPVGIVAPPWIHDYNGDGTSDIAIFRESSGLWAVRDITRVYFGSSIDDTVPGDYNGDGTTEIGIFRGTSGLWAIRGTTRSYFGGAPDLPEPGDYDGDGTADIGIFRESSGLWAIRGVTRVYFGGSSDSPASGYYDGDATKDIGIFRGASGLWAIRNVTRVYFGSSSDTIVPGDYGGDGTWETGIFRGSSGLWAIRGVTRSYFGSGVDEPIPGDYAGDGTDDMGIFRGSSGLWAISGVSRVYFGGTGDVPVTR